MKITAGIVLLTVTVIAAACGALPYRAVFETSHQSQLLWHEDEAFVFLVHGQSGRNSSYAYHLLSTVSAFGAPPQDHRKTTTVFRITSNVVEQHQVEGMAPRLFVADGYVSTGVARWVGGKFEPFVARNVPEPFVTLGAVTPSDGIARKHIYPLDEFSDVEGWSKQTFVFLYAEGAQPVDFQLGGRPARLVISGDASTSAIDLERLDVPAKRLMNVSHRLRSVSLDEYNQIFRK